MIKKISIAIGIVLILLLAIGFITSYADSGRVTTGHEPSYCVKVISSDEKKVTYWGLGYKVVRYVKNSPKEPYENNIGVKMGNWFTKYDLPEQKALIVEYEGKKIEINDYKEYNTIYNILIDAKYDSEICDGINTHKITIDDEVYYLKEHCMEIQKGDKRANITEEDLNRILKIIASQEEMEEEWPLQTDL